MGNVNSWLDKLPNVLIQDVWQAFDSISTGAILFCIANNKKVFISRSGTLSDIYVGKGELYLDKYNIEVNKAKGLLPMLESIGFKIIIESYFNKPSRDNLATNFHYLMKTDKTLILFGTCPSRSCEYTTVSVDWQIVSDDEEEYNKVCSYFESTKVIFGQVNKTK